MSDTLRVLVVLGSVREGRFGPVVANWFVEHARGFGGLEVELFDLVDHPDGGPALSAAVRAADAVVIVTPEYNHSFPGHLKTAVDSMREEWVAKPIAFVSYGAVSGGLRAVEQLRVVFAELHAVTVRDTVSFAFAWDRFDGDGRPKEAELVGRMADRLLRNLTWWARQLREATRRERYPV